MSEEREEKKAVKYAEDTLGVHSVYKEAVDLGDQLKTEIEKVITAAHSIRMLNDQMSIREIELTHEARGHHPEASGAAIERIVKEAVWTDDEMSRIRTSLREAQQDHDEADANVTTIKYRLRVMSARINELGGLLTFYAATK